MLERAGSFFEDARSSADRAQRESASAAYSDSEYWPALQRVLCACLRSRRPAALWQTACSAYSLHVLCLCHLLRSLLRSFCVTAPRQPAHGPAPPPPRTNPPAGAGTPDIGAPLLESAQAFEPKAVQLGFVAGTIPVEKLAAFERLLFRATRGNMFLKFSPVGFRPSSCPTHTCTCLLLLGLRQACGSSPAASHTPLPLPDVQVGAVADPATGERLEKAVFVVFFAGERARQKILKARVHGAFAGAWPGAGWLGPILLRAMDKLRRECRSTGGGEPTPTDPAANLPAPCRFATPSPPTATLSLTTSRASAR